VAGLLDGVRTVDELQACIAEAISRREVSFDGIEPGGDPAATDRIAGPLLRTILREFRRSALLAPTT